MSKASEVELAHARADAATARLARLQSITAALGNTVTQDDVADSVLREAILALECEAGAVVVASGNKGEGLALLREAGSLDPLMGSFTHMHSPGARGPYADVVKKGTPVYLESYEEMIGRYPAFGDVTKEASYGAWKFLPLEIDGTAVGALAFGFGGPRTFTAVEHQFADTVARYCAQALDRVRLRDAAAAALAEAREAREMAEKANNAKTMFLRAMSHELRTPLNAITGYAALLEEGIRGPMNPEQAADLGRIKRAAGFLLHLVNDVLTVARLEGARPMRLVPLAVNPVLVEVESLCALQAKAKGLTLTVVSCDREICVIADAERLQQVLLNLITNAITFTSEGVVSVTCSSDAGAVRICVKDSGVGVSADDLARVFEPFVQADKHLKTQMHQGVGLGLSISRELARGMHGDLMLQSTEGVGSIFTLSLPLAPKAAGAGSSAKTPAEKGDVPSRPSFASKA